MSCSGDVPKISSSFKELIHASKVGDTETVRHLIVSGANMNGYDGEGYQAIHVAAQYGRNDVIKLLNSVGGVKLRTRSKNMQYTPLHLAVLYRRISTIEYLVYSRRVSLQYCNRYGRTVVDFAFDAFNNCCGRKNTECGLINDLSGSKEISEIFQEQSKHFTVKCVCFSVAEYLIKAKAAYLGKPTLYSQDNFSSLTLQYERSYFLNLIGLVLKITTLKRENDTEQVLVPCKKIKVEERDSQQPVYDHDLICLESHNLTKSPSDDIQKDNEVVVVYNSLDVMNSSINNIERSLLELRQQNEQFKLLMIEKDEEITILKREVQKHRKNKEEAIKLLNVE